MLVSGAECTVRKLQERDVCYSIMTDNDPKALSYIVHCEEYGAMLRNLTPPAPGCTHENHHVQFEL